MNFSLVSLWYNIFIYTRLKQSQGVKSKGTLSLPLKIDKNCKEMIKKNSFKLPYYKSVKHSDDVHV